MLSLKAVEEMIVSWSAHQTVVAGSLGLEGQIYTSSARRLQLSTFVAVLGNSGLAGHVLHAPYVYSSHPHSQSLTGTVTSSTAVKAYK